MNADSGSCELSATLDSFFSAADSSLRSALVFPSTLNSYERLQIHNLVANSYPDKLISFSAGEDTQRRILIAPTSLTVNATPVQNAPPANPIATAAPAQQQSQPPEPQNTATASVQAKPGSVSKKKRLPSQALYRPRGARMATEAASSSSASTTGGRQHPAEALAPKNWKDEVKLKLGDNIKLVDCYSLPASCNKSSSAASEFLSEEYGALPSSPSSEFELNILEVFGFPVEYKTGDLTRELDPFKNKYELRWVDDTHAVAIFETEALASVALDHEFPSIKVVVQIYANLKAVFFLFFGFVSGSAFVGGDPGISKPSDFVPEDSSKASDAGDLDADRETNALRCVRKDIEDVQGGGGKGNA